MRKEPVARVQKDLKAGLAEMDSGGENYGRVFALGTSSLLPALFVLGHDNFSQSHP
jgi:hypothetical protein